MTAARCALEKNFAMELRDRVVIITGSTSGLGKALAELIVQEGAKVIVNGRKPDETNRIARELDTTGFVADVTKQEDVASLASFAVKQFGRIDIWINNAGIWMPHTPLEGQGSKRVHAMMEVNFFGTLYGCQAASAQMRKQRGGTIVSILSTSATQYRPDSIGYGASKNAAMSLTKALQNDPARKDIRILGIYPGGMQTHLFDERVPDAFDEYMDPSDVARRIVAHLKKKHPEEELVITKDAS